MIRDLQKTLRNMPYTDMMIVATEFQKLLAASDLVDRRLDHATVAHALAALGNMQMPDRSDISKVEQDSLRKVFTRDRAIKVRKLTNANGRGGWHTEITGPYGASVTNEDLKTALDNLLDTVAAAAALKG